MAEGGGRVEERTESVVNGSMSCVVGVRDWSSQGRLAARAALAERKVHTQVELPCRTTRTSLALHAAW